VYIPQSEGLLLPGGPVGEQAAETLHEMVHPDERTERTLIDIDEDGSFHIDLEDEEHDKEVTAWKALPWWKRPSPYWLGGVSPVSKMMLTRKPG
jgi:hypothetical protein